MIAKCIAILALVAQIYACDCGCGSRQQNIILSGSGSEISPVVLLSSGGSGASFGGACSGAVTRNFVANGKYPVALTNCGPASEQRIPVTTSHFTAPLQEKPTVRLATSIPAPRTVSHSCTCFKTIVRPHVQQQLITVPSVERYVETSHKPVIENIQYEASPVNCGCGVQLVSGRSEGVQLVSLNSGSCGPQTLEIQAQPTQIISVPQSVQMVEVPQVQTIQVPQTVSFGSCSCQC